MEKEIIWERLEQEYPGLVAGMEVLRRMYPIAFCHCVEKAYLLAEEYTKQQEVWKKMEEEIRGAAEKKREEELLKEAIRYNQEELERQAIERKRKKRRIGRRTLKKKALETQRDFGLIKRKKK